MAIDVGPNSGKNSWIIHTPSNRKIRAEAKAKNFMFSLLVVHDHEKLQARIFSAEVDQGGRLASSGEGDDFDDVIFFRHQRKTRDSGEKK